MVWRSAYAQFVCLFFFFFTPFLISLSTSFKHAIRARLEVSMGMTWCGETGVVCLEVVCEFQVGFGFDFLCLTVVMSLISGGFRCEFFFNFLWVSIHGGGGCVVVVVDFSLIYLLLCLCVCVLPLWWFI